MSNKKVSAELYEMREMGGLVANVVITFEEDDHVDEFSHQHFTGGDTMKTSPSLQGALNLEALEDLEEDETVVSVEPNLMFQLPTDPSMPQ